MPRQVNLQKVDMCESRETLIAIKKQYWGYADILKQKGLSQSEKHLRHWLSRKGTPVFYPSESLKKDNHIKNHLDKNHLAAFLGRGSSLFFKHKFSKEDYKGGLTKRIISKKGNIRSPTFFKLQWKDSIDYLKKICPNCNSKNCWKTSDANKVPPNDIMFSLGSFTLVSTIEVDLKKVTEKRFEIEIRKWLVWMIDNYDFKIESARDMYAYICHQPFKDGHCLEKNGLAKPFLVHSGWYHSPLMRKHFISI